MRTYLLWYGLRTWTNKSRVSPRGRIERHSCVEYLVVHHRGHVHRLASFRSISGEIGNGPPLQMRDDAVVTNRYSNVEQIDLTDTGRERYDF